MSRVQFSHTYEYIISIENLLLAWQEFLRDKKDRKDVILFQAKLMDNILELFNDLKNKTYKHSKYEAFSISDSKPRNIHKAQVCDRLLHHAIHRILYPFFDHKFIHDSYSCRIEKGTHKAINRFRAFTRKVSKNNTRTCWILKCDIRKFFANIDQAILKQILSKTVFDRDILWLLGQVIDSFRSTNSAIAENIDRGLPLGNLTSQLLVNIYMNEFDQYVKRELKVKYYIRYADDFVILQDDRMCLEGILPRISKFLEEKLKLQLHPDKVFIKTLASGIDFLGWVHFPDHRVLRTSTKRRMFKNLKDNPKLEVMQSYFGLLKYGNTHKLKLKIIPHTP
ncbi:MAG: reverse transcriptase/maturase family protein [bacterium]|nr:reverse transcriptase/maturase family protein [bacterium]